jgi:hypothetical protein
MARLLGDRSLDTILDFGFWILDWETGAVKGGAKQSVTSIIAIWCEKVALERKSVNGLNLFCNLAVRSMKKDHKIPINCYL